jgi:cyclopropane-fatty-acyl-phospholipid synthase
MLLARLLDHLVRSGTLLVTDAYGQVHRFGDGQQPVIAFRLTDPTLHTRLFFRPRLAFGEAYMDGTLVVEQGGIYGLLDLLCRGMASTGRNALTPLYYGFGKFARSLQQFNPLPRAQRNVAHHYDLSDALYELFLDRDRQYSCAYFQRPDDDLEKAQEAKKRHIASKLLLRPGQKVLDIGCGWGGLAIWLARESGADVTGLTLSKEQHAVATRRAAQAGLSDRVRFQLRDYREETERYDRIVSVGMFEHVGLPHYGEFFAKVKELLAPSGVALLHAIGRSDGPGHTHPWIRKYIFPGGYSPALSEVVPVVERTGLWITDIEILRLHYAETLRHWRERFVANWDRAKAIYDEPFCRMWELYLAGCEATFRHHGHMVWQMQMANDIEAAPLTRDYMVDWERGQHHRRATGRAA